MIPIYKNKEDPTRFAIDLGEEAYVVYYGPEYLCNTCYKNGGKYPLPVSRYSESSWFELLVVHGVTREMFKEQYEGRPNRRSVVR